MTPAGLGQPPGIFNYVYNVTTTTVIVLKLSAFAFTTDSVVDRPLTTTTTMIMTLIIRVNSTRY